MKFCRFVPPSAANSSPPVYGIIERGNILEISGVPWAPWSRTSRSLQLADVRLVAPVDPSKIVCIGRNYPFHAAELGNEVPKEPLMFLKPPSSIVGPEEPIVLTKFSNRVDHEGELAMVIGRRCSQLSDFGEPLSFVLGYTCLNDVTARDVQNNEVQFTRSKGFDTFCPIGPYIETDLDPSKILVETHVNGARRQSGNTSTMTFAPDFLIRWISRMMTLMPGDVISTGTPAGVGPLVAGDTVEVSVAGVGVLRNPVQAP